MLVLLIILVLVSAWIGYHIYNRSRKKQEENKENSRKKQEENKENQERQQRRDIYRNLLKSDKWRSRRREILNRDNHKCLWCGSSKYLQVHHRYYALYPDDSFVEPWDYPDDALMTLCKECHEKAHKLYKTRFYYRRFDEYHN